MAGNGLEIAFREDIEAAMYKVLFCLPAVLAFVSLTVLIIRSLKGRARRAGFVLLAVIAYALAYAAGALL